MGSNYIEAQVKYINSVLGSSHQNVVDATKAYYEAALTGGLPGGAVADPTQITIAAGTDGLAGGTLQAVLQDIYTTLASKADA